MLCLQGDDNPILFLLVDIGFVRTHKATAPCVEVSYGSENESRVWAIHSRGHDEKVFGCLQYMECIRAIEKFFISAILGFSEHS